MRKTVQRLQSPPTPDPSLFPANTNAPPPPPPPPPPSNTPRETIMRKTNLTSTPEKKKKKTSSSRDTTHIIVIIDLHHGSVNTGTQTFHFNQCKHAILRRLTTFNTWAENTTHELWSNVGGATEKEQVSAQHMSQGRRSVSVIIFDLLARFRTTELYSYQIKRNKSFQNDYAMDTKHKNPHFTVVLQKHD